MFAVPSSPAMTKCANHITFCDLFEKCLPSILLAILRNREVFLGPFTMIEVHHQWMVGLPAICTRLGLDSGNESAYFYALCIDGFPVATSAPIVIFLAFLSCLFPSRFRSGREIQASFKATSCADHPANPLLAPAARVVSTDSLVAQVASVLSHHLR